MRNFIKPTLNIVSNEIYKTVKIKLFTHSPLNYKLFAFTLVETIMTLFIIGVVITASIMTFTSKHVAGNIDNTKGAWQPCESSKYSGLCTTDPVVINPENVPNITDGRFSSFNAGNIKNDNLYSLILGLHDQNYLDEYFRTQNENRGIKINDHVIRAERAADAGTKYNNFYISSTRSDDAWMFPISNLTHTYNNIILGDANAKRIRNFHDNVLIGHGNSSCSQTHSNTILGNNNIIRRRSNNFIFGNNNKIRDNNSMDPTTGPEGGEYCNKMDRAPSPDTEFDSNMVIIGNNWKYKDKCAQTPALFIGQGTGVQSLHDIQIGNNLYADAAGGNYTLTFADDVTINGQVHGVATVPSDIRLKNIKSKYNKGLREILELEPVTFYYKNDKTATEHVGIIAQDLGKIFPEAVTKMPNGYLGVDTTPVFFASVNALKEINRQTVAEEKRAKYLEDELLSLEKEIGELNKSARHPELVSGSQNITCNIWCKIKAWFKSVIHTLIKRDVVDEYKISKKQLFTCSAVHLFNNSKNSEGCYNV